MRGVARVFARACTAAVVVLATAEVLAPLSAGTGAPAPANSSADITASSHGLGSTRNGHSGCVF